jgi:hypothetical protein
MIVGEVYRLNSATFGIHSKDGKRTSITVPQGALITVIGGPLDGTRLVDCLWVDMELLMFTMDLRERGTKISTSTS